MKIRTDFVTNSSSSNFTIKISIVSQSERICIEEDPFERLSGGGEASFDGDLHDINEHLSSVEELATWLASSLTQNREDDYGRETASFKKKKTQFIKEAQTKIKSVRDIDSIIVERSYFASGDQEDRVADEDVYLQELARKYLSSTGIEKERAEAEMITYIHTTTDARGYSFGAGSVSSRYKWFGESVKELAERLLSGRDPDYITGIERKELNLKTGEYFDESNFDLT